MIKSKQAAYRDLCEAREIVASMGKVGKTAAAPKMPTVTLDRLPGLSKMQTDQKVSQMVKLDLRRKQILAQAEAVIREWQSIDKDEEAGLEELKNAAKLVKDKGNYIVEATDGLIQFGAFMKANTPGVMQMINDAEWAAKNPDKKAGQFLTRIGTALGKEIEEKVEAIYRETIADLQDFGTMIRQLTVVTKTASVTLGTLRKAGIADKVQAIKSWLSGKASDVAGMAGNIKAWVKGFAQRTKIVKDSSVSLVRSLTKAQAEIEKFMG